MKKVIYTFLGVLVFACGSDSESDNNNDETYTLNFTYDYNDAGYPRNVVVEDVGFGQETIVIDYVD